MNDEIAALRAMVSDLASEVRTRSNSPVQGAEAATTADSATHPFWDVTVCSGLSLTDTDPPTDWDPLFTPSATGYKKFHLATAHGEFDFGALGIGPQRRLSIAWDAAAASTVQCTLCGEYVEVTAGDVGNMQIKLNGKVTEYASATTTVQLSIKPGRNLLVITADDRPATLQFFGILWDETRGDRWVDPRTLPGYLRSTT